MLYISRYNGIIVLLTFIRNCWLKEPLKEKDGLKNGTNGVFLGSIPLKEKDQNSEMTEKDKEKKSDMNEEVTGFFELVGLGLQREDTRVICAFFG